MQPIPKKWYASKTIWFNIVSVIAVILVQLRDVPGIDPAIVPYLAVAIPAVNMVLRLITTQPLALTAGPVAPIPPSPYMAVPSQRADGVSFDTAPAAPPADVATLPTLPGKETHDGQ